MIIRRLDLLLIFAFEVFSFSKCIAFIPPHFRQTSSAFDIQYKNKNYSTHPRTNSIFYSSTSDVLPDIDSMRIGELKSELQSYGISTKSFLEKSELVEAVQNAREQGLKPKASSPEPKATSSTTESTDKTSSTSSESREEKILKEMEKCSSMKAGEMKKELQSMGISTKSFFEKSEFLKALAEARVDGVKKSSAADEEGYAEYANVEVLPANDPGPRKKGAADSGGNASAGAGNPFEGAGAGAGAGGNPFGGAAGGNPFGGAGGMGGIADMLKNMGGGAAGGAPGAGPGGMGNIADMLKNMGGMGDMMGNMGKVQEMVKNPKVMEIIQKAQGNPKIMKAIQECMGNPAAFAKYQNDPEIGGLINELKKYM